MRLLMIRHGDPDYNIDGLTEKGKKEALLLKNRLLDEPIDAVYCSILGRARKTAEPLLKARGLDCEYCDWLREFNVVNTGFENLEKIKACWDLYPEQMAQFPALYSLSDWKTPDFIQSAGIPAYYDRVCASFDALLASHGYRREGMHYRAEAPNHKTLVFFCHFGVASVLLSHLMNCSPYTLWQHTFLPPTSITTFYTEERKDGIASFRCSGMGDIHHLQAGNEPPSFSGRYCECFEDETKH